MMANIRPHIGWMGVFTTDRAPGCWPNGTRIEKRIHEPGDRARIGQTGTVLGSVRVPEQKQPSYFVEWDSQPQAAVLVPAAKIRRRAAT
jgi:hypothetical protein